MLCRLWEKVIGLARHFRCEMPRFGRLLEHPYFSMQERQFVKMTTALLTHRPALHLFPTISLFVPIWQHALLYTNVALSASTKHVLQVPLFPKCRGSARPIGLIPLTTQSQVIRKIGHICAKKSATYSLLFQPFFSILPNIFPKWIGYNLTVLELQASA